MRRDDVEELHYIAPLANLPSLLDRGILSHRRSRDVPHRSVARREIQDVRAKVMIPAGRPLHEYVNLYFDARNPMMRVRHGEHAELCVLRVRADVLDLSDVVIAGQNAASRFVRWAAAPHGLATVDRDLVFARSWEHPGDLVREWHHRLVKCAEVLVPDQVPPALIDGVYVSSPENARHVRDLVPQLAVTVHPDLFFRITASGPPMGQRPCWRRRRAACDSSWSAPDCEEAGKERIERPSLRAGEVALVEILARLEREPHRWPVGRAGFAHLAYFASRAGVPTGLRHHDGPSGPVSPDLESSLSCLMESGLVREDGVPGTPALTTGPAYPAGVALFRTELDAWKPNLDRVVDLFLRMRTRDSEVAATVSFAALRLTRTHRSPSFEMDMLRAVREVGQHRRPPLGDEEIGAAIRHLNMLGHLDARPSPALPMPAGELLILHDFQGSVHPVVS